MFIAPTTDRSRLVPVQCAFVQPFLEIQKERGSPRTCSAMYEKIRFVEIGAT